MRQWHEVKTGNDQGLIIDETTGENIAITYEQEHAQAIVAVPELIRACELALQDLIELCDLQAHDIETTLSYSMLKSALRKAGKEV